MKLRLLLCVVALALLAGCAGTDPLEGVPPDRLFALAQAAGADEDYERAQQLMDRIRDDHPFSRFAVEAELLAADLKYQEEKYPEAAALYRSFEQLHPTHPKVAYTVYRRGMAYWQTSLPAGRDQTATRDAAEAFQKLLYGYPDSEFAGPARVQLAQARSRLAAHEIHVARYYLRRDRWAAARQRLEGVLRDYPDTPERGEAEQLLAETQAEQAAAEPHPE